MIIFELKKIWRSRILWIFFIILFILNVYQINALSNLAKGNSETFNMAREQIYSKVCGKWSNEKTEFIVTNYENAAKIVSSGAYSTEPDQEGTYTGYIFGDFSLFSEFYDEMNYMYNYSETMKATLDNARENVTFFKEKGNKYLAKQNEQIVSLYQNRSIDAYYKTNGAYSLISYDFSSLFILLLCIFCFSSIFSREYETQMYPLLKLTTNGGLKLASSKVLAALISSLIISLIFYVADFICFYVFFDINCLSNPIYSIMDFKKTPFSCSIGQYLLIMLTYRLIGIITISFIYLLCSCIFSDEILSFCACIAVTAMLVFKGGDFNPVMLFTIRDLHKKYTVCNVFKNPIMSHIILLAIMIIVSVLLCIIVIALSQRRYRENHSLKKLLNNWKERLIL